MTGRLLSILVLAVGVAHVSAEESPARLLADVLASTIRWRAFVPAWFEYLDRNGDGQLGETEFRLAPAPAQVHEHWRAGLYPRFGVAGADLKAADENGNGSLSPTELDRYYRQNGAGPLTSRPGQRRGNTTILSARLFALLDRDGDGRLSLDEYRVAATSLRRADLDEDEWLTAEELSPTLGRPELPPPRGPLLVTVPGQPGLGEGIRKFFQQQFAAADRNGRGAVLATDLVGSELEAMRTIFPLADRDGDGRLTAKELTRCVDLHLRWLQVPLTFTLTVERKGLFEMIDVDGDNRLSVREWQAVSRSSLSTRPLALELAWSVGPPGRSGPRPMPNEPDVPAWFTLLDRNGDGDVSAREFVGDPGDFRRLDRDGDGLISRAEAKPVRRKE